LPYVTVLGLGTTRLKGSMDLDADPYTDAQTKNLSRYDMFNLTYLFKCFSFYRSFYKYVHILNGVYVLRNSFSFAVGL